VDLAGVMSGGPLVLAAYSIDDSSRTFITEESDQPSPSEAVPLGQA
jgi:hypothetical protein